MINRVYFYSFFRIMQEKGLIQHYTELFKERIVYKDSKFLQLYIKLEKLFNSLELKNKKIILAVS